MTAARYLRLALIAALIGFTGRADAVCLATGAMPAVQQASDCADTPGSADHEPTPERGPQSASHCPFACVSLAGMTVSDLSAPLPVAAAAAAIQLTVMIGGNDPPPTPPPRAAA
jgi:hypothetical protein